VPRLATFPASPLPAALLDKAANLEAMERHLPRVER